VEGAGKTTQLQRLARRLEGRSVPHRVVREPGGTAAGERIRQVVLDAELELTDHAELLLMLAARAEFVRRLVEPALEAGEVVLADRYELSTFAYQGMARELGLERVREMNAFATGGRKPDLTVLLRVGPGEARRRRAGEVPDRLEGAGEGFHAEVARAYERLAATEEHVRVVDAEGPPDEVEARIARLLAEEWPETFAVSTGS
jgi:dTMP kinase